MENTNFPYFYPFNPQGVSGKVVQLIQNQIAAGGLVVDLGAGGGTIGLGLQGKGFGYLGFDNHPGALKVMQERNLENGKLDLLDFEAIKSTLSSLPQIDVICLLDVLEHLEEPQKLLYLLQNIARQQSATCRLIISVPNVTHFDIAVKLLLGQWEVRPKGLLDADHIRFFNGEALTALLKNSGWQINSRLDYYLPQSDQYEPTITDKLDPAVLNFLQELNQQANPYSQVNNFIWCLQPSPEVPPTELDFVSSIQSGTPAILPDLTSLRLPSAASPSDSAQHLELRHQQLLLEYGKLQAWAKSMEAELKRKK